MDHAFLEAEYQRNPKPDKAARTSIVQRVALNDKEVQVSFRSLRSERVSHRNELRNGRPIPDMRG